MSEPETPEQRATKAFAGAFGPVFDEILNDFADLQQQIAKLQQRVAALEIERDLEEGEIP